MIAHCPAGDPVGPSLGREHIVVEGKRLEGRKRRRWILRKEVGEPLRCIGRQSDGRSAHDFGTAHHREIGSSAQHPCRSESRRHAGRACQNDRKCGDIRIELGVKPGLASNVAPTQIRDHGTPDEKIRLCLRRHRLHKRDGQRDGIISSQSPSAAAEGSAKAGGNKDGFSKAAHDDLQILSAG